MATTDVHLTDPYLGSTQLFSGAPNSATGDLSNLGGGFNGGSDLGALPTTLSLASDPTTALTDWGSTLGADSSLGTAATTPTSTTSAASSAGGSWWQNLLGSLGGGLSGIGGQLAGLGPYAAVAGYGLSKAGDVQKQNEAYAKQLADLGGPYTQAGQTLLKQFQSGQIRPDQTAVADLAKTSGQNLINSGAGLSAIAQQAYRDYQAGKLPAADEQRLSDQIASQKQQLRSRLGQSGIADSSILAGYDQQIDNQALITRQDLLDKRFATGNQAYDEWLKSTTQGQKLQLEGAEFASKALDSMLNQSLSLGAEGMEPVAHSIQLAMQSDQQLAQQVTELMGNLASAYAYSRGGGTKGPAGSVGAGGGGGGSTIGSILGDASKAYGLYQDMTGSGGISASDASTWASGAPADQSLQAALDAGLPSDYGSPSAAGGEAASSSNWLGTGLGYANAGLGIYSGLTSGKPAGQTGAALQAAQLAAKGGIFGSSSGAVGGAAGQGLNALGVYSGLKQGGAAGYAQAANSAYGLATGTAGIPGVGAALSAYNFAENWQSGDTKGDTVRGAEAGAAIGSIVPGIGTLVGGVIGGAVGAISSAFGNGEVDPENSNFSGFTQAYNSAQTPEQKHQVAASTADPYLPLAGLFDLRPHQIKGNIPIYSQYGRMGEGRFVTDMFSQINSAVKGGTISKASSTDDIMSKVVAPWIDSFGKGKTQDVNADAINAMIAGIVDDYRTGQTSRLKAIGGDEAFSNVPAFGS